MPSVDMTGCIRLLSYVCPDGTWSEVIETLARDFSKRKTQGRVSMGSQSRKAKDLENDRHGEGISKSMSWVANSNLTERAISSRHETRGFSALKKRSGNFIRDLDQKADQRTEAKTDQNTERKTENLAVGKIPLSQPMDHRSSGPSDRVYIQRSVKRELLRRAKNCCEYVDRKSNKRCSSVYQLQVEHIRPIALGGGNESSNLRILCRTHNALMARKGGLGPMARH